jgi:hypothetical protein
MVTTWPHLRCQERRHLINLGGDIKSGKDEVFITSPPTGCSNNDIGLAWLEQLYTERRARQWRSLILDGHGSHLTMELIEYCYDQSHQSANVNEVWVMPCSLIKSCISHASTTPGHDTRPRR